MHYYLYYNTKLDLFMILLLPQSILVLIMLQMRLIWFMFILSYYSCFISFYIVVIYNSINKHFFDLFLLFNNRNLPFIYCLVRMKQVRFMKYPTDSLYLSLSQVIFLVLNALYRCYLHPGVTLWLEPSILQIE